MKVLVIAPHPDDEVIGCGGAVSLHLRRGDHVMAVFLTSGELGLKQLKKGEAWTVRESEARRAAGILGFTRTVFLRQPDWNLSEGVLDTAETLAPILRTEQPHLVYAPHEQEWHPDHKTGLPLLRRAVEHADIPAPEVRAYEVWTPLLEFDCVENITDVMPRKLRALRAHRSQLAEFNLVQAVRGLNAFRGALAGKCRYAEVFQRVRLSSIP